MSAAQSFPLNHWGKMIMPNDNTMIKVKTRLGQGSDILNRIYKAIEIIQDQGYEVVSVGCSSKVFMEISKRFAPKVGFVERQTLLLQQRRYPTDIPKNIPLSRDNALIYNKEKQFYLKVIDPASGKNGLVFPTFNKSTVPSLEIKDG